MENITHQPLTNIGGNLRTLYIMDSFRAPFYQVKDLKVRFSLNLTTWSKFDFTFNTLSFTQEPVDVAGLDAFKKMIIGFIPKDRHDIYTILKRHSRVVVVITDRNGVKRVVGDNANPAVLKVFFNNGPGADDANRYRIEISQTDKDEAPYYDIE
jgi:hypothetical protein